MSELDLKKSVSYLNLVCSLPLSGPLSPHWYMSLVPLKLSSCYKGLFPAIDTCYGSKQQANKQVFIYIYKKSVHIYLIY